MGDHPKVGQRNSARESRAVVTVRTLQRSRLKGRRVYKKTAKTTKKKRRKKKTKKKTKRRRRRR